MHTPLQELHALLGALYPGQAGAILQQIGALPRAAHLPKPPQCIYVTYADSFSVGGRRTFEALTAQLPRIRQLGCDTIHVLPFLKSPMVDTGFDISDYLHVREDLGGDEGFTQFLEAAHAQGMEVIIDLVLNHVSDQHDWFIKAQAGDERYRDFFVHSKEKPVLLRIEKDEIAAYAVYSFAGQEVRIMIIFPEHAGTPPHFVQGTDGLWYYHTFYPQQIDVDWNNPDVFVAYAQIIAHWASRGVSFRLDAVPHIGKEIWLGSLEGTDRTHMLIAALRNLSATVNPASRFLVEAAAPTRETIAYFGENAVESDMAYNFPLNALTWTALMLQEAQYLWEAVEQTVDIPQWADWVTLLRNHDGLFFSLTDPSVRARLHEKLEGKGILHNEGLVFAGRTASFLVDEERIILAHALLASLPGIPAIVYGDENGKENDFPYMHAQTALKRKRDPLVQDDARDINRGVVDETEIASPKALRIAEAIGTLLNLRHRYSLRRPTRLRAHTTVFAASYEQLRGTLIVLCNLGDTEQHMPLQGKPVLALNGAKLENNVAILPGYSCLWAEC